MNTRDENHLSPHGQPTPADTSHPTDKTAEQARAAGVIRDQIDAIYDQAPPHKSEVEDVQAPYNRTYNNADYNLQQYHSAWQQYYQQYYQRYYLQQLHIQRQQEAAEKAKLAAQPIQPAEPQIITGGEPEEIKRNKLTELRSDLLGKIKERAGKVRRSHHFMPIVSALLVGFIFLFLQYNRFLFAEVNAYVSPGSTTNQNETVLVDPSTNLNVGPEPKLIIPKINVNIRVVYDVTSVQDAPVQEGLNRGVVHYKLPGASSLPGQVGNSVILGHSSNDIFDPGDYKFAFVLLEKLEAGDIFYMHYEGKRYIYKVTGKEVIKPTEISKLQIETNKPLMTLVTCTPLGTAINRLLVYSEQISPDPASAAAPASGNASDRDVELPGNSPTFLERIRDFFF